MMGPPSRKDGPIIICCGFVVGRTLYNKSTTNQPVEFGSKPNRQQVGLSETSKARRPVSGRKSKSLMT